MNRAVGYCSHAAIADVGEDVATLSVIIVRVEVGVLVMLHAKVVPTNPQIKRQTVGRFPRILEIGAEFMVTIAPSKDWLANGERYCTARDCACCTTREFSLWVDGRLKLPKYTIQEVFVACPEVRSAEGFDSFLVGPETPVVSDVSIVAAEAERVTTMDRAEVLVSLDEVLWASEGNRIARCERRIPWHANKVPFNFGSRNGVHV